SAGRARTRSRPAPRPRGRAARTATSERIEPFPRGPAYVLGPAFPNGTDLTAANCRLGPTTSTRPGSRRNRVGLPASARARLLAAQVARGSAEVAPAQPRPVDGFGPAGAGALPIDDGLLRGGDAADDEIDLRVEVALEQREPDRSELVVAHDGAEAADRSLPRADDLGARLRGDVLGSVEVQEREPPRRL